MRESVALILLSISACGFEGASGGEVVDVDGPAAGGDGGAVAVPTCQPGFLDLCALPVPSKDLSLAGTEVDTDRDNRCIPLKQKSGPDVCLFYFRKIEIMAGTVLAHGSRPLALVATESMRVAGVIDVSSRRDRLSKPGAGSALCLFATAPAANSDGAGGGAGGTLGTKGGAGGIGNRDGTNAAGGTPGEVVTTLSGLRGGCHGQPGAVGASAPGGVPGLGGGGVYLGAATLQLTGSVLAGGSGTGGNADDDGGGGGGSGGVIVVQSNSLTISGRLFATGGGGGKGGADNGGGEPGADGVDDKPADGGQRGPGGGPGGKGGSTEAGQKGADNNGGGGGGGGGGGLIVLIGSDPKLGGSKIAPAPSMQPR